MAEYKFRLGELVRRIGHQEVRTVVNIHRPTEPGGEDEYKIQLGTDVVWDDESKLEFVPTENRVKARPVDLRDKHLPKRD